MPDLDAAIRGKCPDCGRWMQLKRDGRLRHHAGPAGSGTAGWSRAYRCAGAAKLPAREVTPNA